jgi:chemotaxis-related protein WspD
MTQYAPPPGSRPDCWNDVGAAGDGTCPVLTEVSHCRNCPVYGNAGRKFLERQAPEGYLAEWTQALAEEETSAEETETTLVVFRLVHEWLALPATVIQEVTVAAPIHRIPRRSNRILLGLANLRGELQLCVSLHGLLGIEFEETVAECKVGRRMVQRMAVIEKSGQRWAFPVDEMFGTYQASTHQISSVPSTIGKTTRTFTRRLVDWHDTAVGVLDEDLVLSALARAVT